MQKGLQLIFAILGQDQLYGSASEIFVGRNDIQALDLRFLDYLLEGFVQDQGVIDGASGRIFGESDGSSGVGLGIAIDKQGRLFGGSEAGREVDSRCGLTNSTFLVCNRDDPGQDVPPNLAKIAERIGRRKLFHVEQTSSAEFSVEA